MRPYREAFGEILTYARIIANFCEQFNGYVLPDHLFPDPPLLPIVLVELADLVGLGEELVRRLQVAQARVLRLGLQDLPHEPEWTGNEN